MSGLHGSWPIEDPDGIVLRLWSERGHIDLKADELNELVRLVAGARDRIRRRDSAPTTEGDET